MKQREIIGTAREIFKRIHSKPKWAYPEGILNSFTAVKSNYIKSRAVFITLRVLNEDETHDAWIEDAGIGFVDKYWYLENKMGYDPNTEEYKQEQMDPNNLNKMGIGLNSIAALSKIGKVEFRTVSRNEQGQEMGLVCTYFGDDQSWGPPQPLSPQYVLERRPQEIKTGTKAIIKDVRDFSFKDIESFLIDIFARKIGDKDEYTILLRSTPQEKYTELQRPPNGRIMCTCSEETIGYIKNKYGIEVPVIADLHAADKIGEAKVKFLVKRIKLGMYENEYLMWGHIWCDAAEIKPDREGVVIDEYDNTYRQIDEVVTKYAIARGFMIKSEDTTGDENIKGRKTWEQKAQENILKYYEKFGDDTVLPLNSLKHTSILDAEPGKLGKLRKKKTVKEGEMPTCPKGQRWDSELNQCVDIQHRNKKNKKHRHRRKVRKLSDDYDLSAIPQIKIKRGNREGKSGFFAELDVSTTTLWIDTHYAWVRENNNLESASPELIDLFTMMAHMKAVPENQDLTQSEFFTKLTEVYQT